MNDKDIRKFRKQIKMLQRRLRQELLPVNGLSRTELQVLGCISHSSNMTPRDVADELRMTTSNVAAALRALESAQLIERAKNPNDARRVNLSITSTGKDLIGDIHSDRDSWLARAIAAQLTSEEYAVLLQAGELMERLSHFEPPAH